eukprot:scaffold2951_cov81-Cyclotella_meneghiniana.AAC.2
MYFQASAVKAALASPPARPCTFSSSTKSDENKAVPGSIQGGKDLSSTPAGEVEDKGSTMHPKYGKNSKEERTEAEALLVDGGTVITDKRNGKGEVAAVVKAAQASPPSISSSKKSVQSVVPGSIEACVDHYSASVAKNGMNADVTETSMKIGAVDNVGGLGDSKLLIKEEVSHAASVVEMNVVSPDQVTSYDLPADASMNSI